MVAFASVASSDSVASAFRRKGTLWRHRPVAVVDERADLFPVDRLVHPHAHPQPAAVRRREAANVLQRRGGVFLSSLNAIDGRPFDHLERAEHLAAGLEHGMSPRERFDCSGQSQTLPPGPGKHRPVVDVSCAIARREPTLSVSAPCLPERLNGVPLISWRSRDIRPRGCPGCVLPASAPSALRRGNGIIGGRGADSSADALLRRWQPSP